jgi:toxin ParE1/3/4
VKGKPLLSRERAKGDVDQAIDFYSLHAGSEAALRFAAALERSYRHIEKYPASGSLRCAHELGLVGLRSWPAKGFPYIVFFVERDSYIEVWRVLHAARDITAQLDQQ